jgi:hypoxanthine phosphoribosyltransferase
MSDVMEDEEKPFKIELVSNATVTRLVRKLAHQIQDNGFSPDIVVCIARGGYVPARLLCDFLNIFNLASMRIRHYTGSDKSEAAELVEKLSMDVGGKKILLVDDVDDTGDTLQIALDYLRSMQPREIKVAVLHHKLISSLVPDFYAQKIIRWRWITYPWAVIEDALGFVNKLSPQPTSPQQAISEIENKYGIRLSRKTMEDVFRLL